MTLKVEILSKETIKPSFPTPQHHKNFKFSLIDQYVPPIHAPVILFYPFNGELNEFDKSKKFNRLKKSLSETLTEFYPLAGRIIDNQHVECDDTGVEYVETQVGAELIQVVSCPKEEDMNALVPCDHATDMTDLVRLLAIQVNEFKCGGLAIAICGSHKICDGAGLGTFVESWAKRACGSSEKIVIPTFDGSKIFPPKEIDFLVVPDGVPIKKVVTRKFIFNSSKISALKDKASHTLYVENPTRVEAIVALIWRCAMNASRERVGFFKPSLVNLVMNLRGKMNPPLPDHSFGNLVMGAITPLTHENEIDLHRLVAILRETKRKLDEDYLKKLPVNEVLALGHESMINAHIQYFQGVVEFYTFSSLLRFPFYEADFGWGKPIWANCLNLPYTNMITLMNTSSGDGIEAWVCLDQQDMARFEQDEELLAYASPAVVILSKL